MKRLAWCIAFVGGCALTSKASPRELRYFAPELPVVAAAVGAPCGQLRIGRIEADDALRLPIVHRLSPVEVAPYETLRWTELPDAYARTAVVTDLFVQRPLEQALDGGAPVLDVKVAAFEEVGDGAGRAGRVELRFELHDDRRIIARAVIRKQQPSATPAIDDVVAAIGLALHAATADVADRVVAAVCRSTAG